MQKKYQWNQSTFKFTKKKAHSAPLIGLSVHTPSTFLSSSQDHTVRLWDLRTQSSVKLIRSPMLANQQLSNPQTNGQNAVFVGAGSRLYQFDMRKEEIFVERLSGLGDQQHYDCIGRLRYCRRLGVCAAADDQGDVRVYQGTGRSGNDQNTQNNHEKDKKEENQSDNKETKKQIQNKYNLQIPKITCKYRLQQHHTNLLNALDFIHPQSSQFQHSQLLLSGGYDSTLILWNMPTETPLKKIPICQLLQKYNIPIETGQNTFIHSVQGYGSSVLVGIDSGHVLCLPVGDLRKAKFLFRASLVRVNDCRVMHVGGKKLLGVAAADDSFGLFDYEQRVDGAPKFLQKYGTIAEPVQIQTMGGTVLVVTHSSALSFYCLKQ